MPSTKSTEPIAASTVRDNEPSSDPLASMRTVCTTLRQDLQITRTTNRGEALYVVFDPVSFRSHRLTLGDYRVVARMVPERTLQECFEDCVKAGILAPGDEPQFYQFIKQLGTLGLLTAERPDPTLLYERYIQQKKAATKSQLLGFLFLTIPLSNPDKFLDRTIGRFRFLFATPAVVAWLIGMFVAIAIVIARWELFWEPLNSLLAVKNLLFLSVTFIGLKIWHELGHGYACKLFGGRVPEMGCKLIVGMPLAYVDASSAWSFPRRRDRITVMLGGMYFELLLVVPAALVWAYWPHTTIGSFAYQIVLMAGIATLLFNLNPLMKFDGYFILSELVGITNLRTRSVHEVTRVLKKHILGITPRPSTAANARDLAIMLIYGVAATLYGWGLMLSIAVIIATRFQALGLAIAAFQLGTTLFRGVKKLHQYLWLDEETAPVRNRAKGVGWGIAFATPLIIGFCPVLTSQYASGVVTAAKTTQLRVATPGYIAAIANPVPEFVEAGQPLVILKNLDIDTNVATGRLSEDAARRSVLLLNQLARDEGAKQLQVAITEIANRAMSEKLQDELTIRASHSGRLASLLPKQRVGTYLQTGEVVAQVVDGSTQVRAWLNEEQLATSNLSVGGNVSLRISSDLTRSYTGTVHSVAPANKTQFEDVSLTTIGEGTIPYDPITGETLEKVFQLLIDVPELDSQQALQGLSVSVRISRRYESLGRWTFRQTAKFANAIFTGAK